MTGLSYMGANLVAQQVGWEITDWMQGEDATNAHYEPIETFPERFGAFVQLVANSGFRAIDIWTAQLHWRWATPAHLEAARAVLASAGLTVSSYAGLYGEHVDEFNKACAVATGIGAPILSGNTALMDTDRRCVIAGLQTSGLRLAVENHPETDPQQLLLRIGTDGGDRIGAPWIPAGGVPEATTQPKRSGNWTD